MIPNSLTRFSLSSPSAPVRSIARFLVILLADIEDEKEKSNGKSEEIESIWMLREASLGILLFIIIWSLHSSPFQA